MYLVGVIVGYTSLQFSYRYFFLEFDFLKPFFKEIMFYFSGGGIDVGLIFMALITFPYYSILGIVLGCLLSFYTEIFQRVFILGFLTNFIIYFILPVLNFDVVNILIQSPAGEPKLRYYELCFSNLYSLIFICFTIWIFKYRKICFKQRLERE